MNTNTTSEALEVMARTVVELSNRRRDEDFSRDIEGVVQQAVVEGQGNFIYSLINQMSTEARREFAELVSRFA